MMAASGKPAEEHAPNGNQIMDDGHGVSQVLPSPGECVLVEGTLRCGRHSQVEAQ